MGMKPKNCLFCAIKFLFPMAPLDNRKRSLLITKEYLSPDNTSGLALSPTVSSMGHLSNCLCACHSVSVKARVLLFFIVLLLSKCQTN